MTWLVGLGVAVVVLFAVCFVIDWRDRRHGQRRASPAELDWRTLDHRLDDSAIELFTPAATDRGWLGRR